MAGATSGTVAVLVFVSLFSPPAPVPAYDRGDCQRIFPQGTVLHDVDSLRIDTGNYYEVDFGDELHLLGSPQGNAVICWQQGRHGVAVIGRLYVDPRTSSSQHCVKIELDFSRRDGSHVTSRNGTVCTGFPEGALQSTEIRFLVTDHDLHSVRIRLFGGSQGQELAYSATRHYGD